MLRTLVAMSAGYETKNLIHELTSAFLSASM